MDDDPLLRDALVDGVAAEVVAIRRHLENLVIWRSLAHRPLALRRTLSPLSPWLRGISDAWRADRIPDDVELEVDVSPDLPSLPLDRARLQLALENLLAAVLAAAVPGDVVRITAALNGTGVAIRLVGPGATSRGADPFAPFPPDLRYDRFPPDPGIGLTVARELVRAHGGRLAVADAGPRAVSAFVLWLPAAD